MADEPNETLVPQPPRALRGRRARQLWRAIAPEAARNGTLTPAAEPLLLILCRHLARVYDPRGGRVGDADYTRIRDLCRHFGVLQ